MTTSRSAAEPASSTPAIALPRLVVALAALSAAACSRGDAAVLDTASLTQYAKPAAAWKREGPVKADTTGGRTRAVSPDGEWIAEVRATPGVMVDMPSQSEATELWVMRKDGSQPRKLVRGTADDAPERTLAGFHSPRFSPDGGTIYFLSEAWVTSAAVHAVDVASGSERFVAPGNSLHVVQRGKYAGHLVVSQHRYWQGGGSYDWPWLVTPEGKALRPLLHEEPGEAELGAALAALEAEK
ncbi:MAG TPA: hypothetical protein VFQ45_08655 [Longimicrobium sp.]|nr:hypothetical protein [Longimicrobium sp.]